MKSSFLSSWVAFIASLSVTLQSPVEVNAEVVIIALTGVIAVVSTLIGVINTVKNDAFKNSQAINAALEKQIEKLEKTEIEIRDGHAKRVSDLEGRIEKLKGEAEQARLNNIQNDDYIRLLVRLLSEHNISIPPFIHPPV